MTKETNPTQEVEISNLPTSNEEIVTDQTEIEGGDQELELELDLESEEETEEELEETEYEGKKYNLPKGLKHALLRQSDYTKKTQEVANERKTVESERQTIQKIREAHQKEFKAYAEVYNLDTQLAEYAKIDWNKLLQEDQGSYLALDREFKTLQDRKNQRLQEINKIESERSQTQQQEAAKREEETRQTLSRDIKNWSIDTESKLTDYAKSRGVPEEAIKGAIKYDAVAVKILHESYLYQQLLKKATQKPKNPTPPAPIKPISMKNTKSLTSEPSDKDSVDEWLKKRNAQIRAQHKKS